MVCQRKLGLLIVLPCFNYTCRCFLVRSIQRNCHNSKLVYQQLGPVMKSSLWPCTKFCIIFLTNKTYNQYQYHFGFRVHLDLCRRYGVHCRLQSTCVGSFTCPGIDTQVQGTTALGLIWQTLLNNFCCSCPGRGLEPTHCAYSGLQVKCLIHSTIGPGHWVTSLSWCMLWNV